LHSSSKDDFHFLEGIFSLTHLILILILTVSNPYKYHSFSFIFHLASSLALKGGDSTERGVGLGGLLLIK
jgi:hypothetical protein